MMKFKQSPVVFNEDHHTYTLNGKRLSGITGLIHQVLGLGVYPDADPYVEDFVIPRAGSRGTAVHHAIQAYEKYGMPTTTQVVRTKYGCHKRDNISYVDETWDVSNEFSAYLRHLSEYRFKPLACELTVSDNKKWASNIDNVWQYEETGGIWLVDTKTNNIKRYPVCGYFNPNYFACGRDALKEYLSWQLSIYAELFELENPGMKVEGLACNWLRDDEDAFWIIERKPSELVWELLKTDYMLFDSGFSYYHPDQSIFGIGCTSPIGTLPTPSEDTLPILPPDVVAYTTELLREHREVSAKLEKVKEGLKKAMKAHNLKSCAFDSFTASISADGTTSAFDTKRFKKEHPDLYNEYVVKKERKGSFTLKLKDDDKD